MNAISKIIYDALASGGGIFMPEVGSLHVEREGAEFVSRNELRPPHSKVVYSAEQLSWLKSVVDILADTYRTTVIEAELQYARWLEEITGERELVEINGVGVIKNGLFYPSVDLYKRLNQASGTSNIVLRRPAGRPHWPFIAAGSIVALGLICLLIALCRGNSCGNGWYKEKTRRVVVVRGDELTLEEFSKKESSTRDGADSDRYDEQFRSDSRYRENDGRDRDFYDKDATADNNDGATRRDGHEDILRNRDSESLRDRNSGGLSRDTDSGMPSFDSSSRRPAERATAEGARSAGLGGRTATQSAAPVYYVVAGVFSYRANAEKCVANDPLNIGPGGYKIYPYKNGMYMVSAFESKQRSVAETRRWELSNYQWDVWVYEGNL